MELPTSRPKSLSLLRVALPTALAAAALALPAAAQAGVAVSTAPDLPGGARAGTDVTVKEDGIPGQVAFTQTFTGADTSAIARVNLIRLSLACGPGPSPGNPDSNGPALNTPEVPCSNPDPGVFGALSAIGTGGGACVGNTFAMTGPDAQGQVDLLPTTTIFMTNGQTCVISFDFKVHKMPTKDTFPLVSGMHTTSVSAVRSEIVANPGNPGSIGLQAAALGSGGAVLVKPEAAAGKKGKKGGPAKLHMEGVCVGKVLTASVTGGGIKKVAFQLDRRTIDVDKKGPFKLRQRVQNLSFGRHRLSANITFTSGSRANEVLTENFSRCRAPNFTG